MTPLDLISLQEAKNHLGETDPEKNGEVDTYRIMACGVILDYLEVYDPEERSPAEYNNKWDEWQEDGAPSEVKAATKIALSILYDHRDGEVNPISPAVVSLLDRRRTPAMS